MSSYQWTVKWSTSQTLVKCSNLIKDWSNKRGLTANIDIFGISQQIWTIGLKMAYWEN